MSEPTLRELLHGKGSHADPVACVEDLSAELAGKKVDGYPHSIWEILGHVNYWMDYDLRRIEGEKPAYPEHASESWPDVPSPAGERQWREELARFSALLERVGELSDASAEALDREVDILHPSHALRSRTVRAALWQIVAHNSYHAGQIVMLRQCLGAWPSRGGGDTW